MSNELVKAEEMPTWARSAVQQYLNRDVNLLLPALPVNADLGFGHKPMVSVVRVSADPKDGDCYKVGSRKDAAGKWENLYALAKPALDRIASGAGINFVTVRVDDRSNRDRCEVECRAAMKNESGAWVVKTYRKELDMRDVEDARRQERQKANASLAAKDKKSDAELEAELRAEMAQYRKHLAARCETGAILRAVRGQLGLKAQWVQSELAKPFVVLRVDFAPDASDPVARRFLLEQGSRASEALFGQMGRTREIVGAEVVHEAGVVSVESDDLPAGELPQETPARPKTVDEVVAGTDEEMAAYIRQGVEALGLSTKDYMDLAAECGYEMRRIVRKLDERAREGPQ